MMQKLKDLLRLVGVIILLSIATIIGTGLLLFLSIESVVLLKYIMTGSIDV